MKKQTLAAGIISLLGIFFLILDRSTAIEGIQQGLTLCFTVVIPGLFPFFFLTNLMSSALKGWDIPGLKSIGKLIGLPVGGHYLLIPAFLGGYPMGANAISEGYQSGNFNYETAQRLLYFCSNAGPAFFFGILPAAIGDRKWILSLWIIHMVSAFLISLLLPAKPCSEIHQSKEKAFSIGEVMSSSLHAVSMVCGWVLMFKILLGVLDHWIFWRFPDWVQILCGGFLELTNGCLNLVKISSLPLRFLLAAAFTGWGGLCIAMQTGSLLGDLPLSTYLTGKFLHAVISFILAGSAISGHLHWAVIGFSVFFLLVKGIQIKGRKKPSCIV